MKWVVQKNLKNPDDIKLYENLERLGIDVVYVTQRPFATELEDEIDIKEGEFVFTYGFVSLANIAKKKGWFPGSFMNENYNYQWLLDTYGNACLNSDAKIMPLKEVADYMRREGMYKAFARPSEDTKAFLAKMYTPEEFDTWCEQLRKIPEGEFSTVHDTTMTIVCELKPIEQEYRFFIVCGKVVTGSLYKRGTQVIYEECNDPCLITFVNTAVRKKSISDAFVMDIAISEGVPYILEINNINSSGLYAIDSQKWIMAMEQMCDLYYKHGYHPDLDSPFLLAHPPMGKPI
jgi:hypothetical protein